MKQYVRILAMLAIALTFGARAWAGGFVEDHANGNLRGWTKVGGRGWTETGGQGRPADAQGVGGFLITNYPCSDNGSFEATILADAWNGQHGGLVFRWTSPSSFYFVSVRPGNQYDNSLILTKNSTEPSKGIVLARNLKVANQFNLRVDLQGATLRFYLNGVQVAAVTDTEHPAGRVGYGYSNQWNSYTRFESSSWMDAAGSTAPTVLVEPGKVDVSKVKLQVQLLDEGVHENNIIKPRLYIENIGTETVTQFRCYYYFKVTENKVPVLEKYYAPNVDIGLRDLGAGDWCIEYSFANLSLEPGQAIPDRSGIVVGVHFEDYSPMNKADDFSNPGTNVFKITSKIPLFLDTMGADDTVIPIPLGGENPTKLVGWRRIKLVNLHCYETESWWSADKCLLDVRVDDGQWAGTYKREVNTDQDWALNDDDDDYLIFQKSARISLYDHDGALIELPVNMGAYDFDDDDHLGTVTLKGDDPDDGYVGKFTLDDADYSLTFQLTTEYFDEAASGPEDIALNNFKNSKKAGLWPSIPDKDKLIQQMEDRLKNPKKVDQGDNKYGFCGVAAVVFEMARKTPLHYVIACRDLYEKGKVNGRNTTIQPAASVRSKSFSGVASADWLLFASLVDSRDLDIEGTKTYIGPIREWTGEALGYANNDSTTTFVWGEKEALADGNDCITKRNGVCFLQVNNEILKPGLTGPLPVWVGSNHWVVLLGDVDITWGEWCEFDNATMRFRVWGSGEFFIDTDETTLEDYFFGTVTGW